MWAARVGAATALLLVGSCAAVPGTSSRLRLSRDTFVVPAAVLRVVWSRPLVQRVPLLAYKLQEFASAAVDGNGRIFIGSSAKVFYALHPRDGSVLWSHRLTGAISSEPLYLPAGTVGPEALVLVGDDDGALTALVADRGAVRWTYRVHGTIRARPSYCEGLVLFTSSEGRLYAVDARSGAWRWQYEREAPESFGIRGTSGPICSGGRVFAGFPDGYLVALGVTTGEALWTRQLSGESTRFADVDSTPALHAGTLYATSYAAGVYALDAKDGSTRWRYELEGAGPLALDAAAGRLYVSAAKVGIHCLDTEGHLLWRQALAKQGELSEPTVWGRYVLLSAAAGGSYLADAATGELLQHFNPGQGITGRPVAAGQRVYVLSNTGVFFALSTG